MPSVKTNIDQITHLSTGDFDHWLGDWDADGPELQLLEGLQLGSDLELLQLPVSLDVDRQRGARQHDRQRHA